MLLRYVRLLRAVADGLLGSTSSAPRGSTRFLPVLLRQRVLNAGPLGMPKEPTQPAHEVLRDGDNTRMTFDVWLLNRRG